MPPNPSPSGAALTLRLVYTSTDKKGREFPLQEDAPTTTGRGRDADVVLKDVKASRLHARFVPDGGDLFVEDLDSANGTLVNGSRIQGRQLLYAGDLIEIGEVRLRAEPKVPKTTEEGITEATLPKTGAEAYSLPTLGNLYSGEFDRGKLRTMLQFLAEGGKTGALILHTSWGGGRIFLEDGRVIHAVLDRSPGMQASKGTLEFGANESPAAGQTLHAPVKRILQDQTDFETSFARLESLMGSLETPIAPDPQCTSPDSTLGPTDAKVLDLVRKHGRLAPILDGYDGSDREAVRSLLALHLDKRIRFKADAAG